jgi:hypothetical protein
MVAFTGSTATAKRVMATCAETLTPVLVECGGKDPLLVDADADLTAAADAAVWGGMSNAGQTCVGVERVYVHEAVAEAFTAKVVAKTEALRPGAFGPMTLPAQVDVVRRHLADALARGGRAVVGGPASVRPPYIDPVVLVDVPEDSAAVTEETFGPLLVVNRVRDMDEAVERANASGYGLGATVFAKKRGTEIAASLRCGMVSVNSVIAFAGIPALPFGGTGDSGFGRIHGQDGLRAFTRPQAVARQRFAPPIALTTFRRTSRAMRALVGVVRLRHDRVQHSQGEIGAGGRVERRAGRADPAGEHVGAAARLDFADQPAGALAVHGSVAGLQTRRRDIRPRRSKRVRSSRVQKLPRRHGHGPFHGVDVTTVDRELIGKHPLEEPDLFTRRDRQIAVQPEHVDLARKAARPVLEGAKMLQLAITAD